MKFPRKRKLLLILAVLAVPAFGYFLFCSRPFYLRPTVEFSPAVEASERILVSEWIKNHSGFSPAPFEMRILVAMLVNPFDTHFTRIWVYPSGSVVTGGPDHLFLVERQRQVGLIRAGNKLVYSHEEPNRFYEAWF
jgi:hypothetical protein